MLLLPTLFNVLVATLPPLMALMVPPSTCIFSELVTLKPPPVMVSLPVMVSPATATYTSSISV